MVLFTKLEAQWMSFNQRDTGLWGKNRAQVSKKATMESLSLQKKLGEQEAVTHPDLDAIPWSFRSIEVKIRGDTMSGI